MKEKVILVYIFNHENIGLLVFLATNYDQVVVYILIFMHAFCAALTWQNKTDRERERESKAQ